MIKADIRNNLKREGFVHIMASTEKAEVLAKKESEKSISICSIIDNTGDERVTAHSIAVSASRIREKYASDKFDNVNVMHIIITGGEEQIGFLEEEGVQFWIVDLSAMRLMIFENQPDDYYGLRGLIEDLLSASNIIRRAKIRSKYDIKGGNIPVVTSIIIAVNIVVFILCELLGSTESTGFMLEAGALNPELVVENREFYRIITCTFLHFGFMHLANNMFMLGVVGVYVEKWLGHLKYAMLYFISGICASLTSLVYHVRIGEDAVCAGASGAIYGVFGAMVLMMILARRKAVKGNSMAHSGIRQIVIVLFLLVFGSIQEGIDYAAHIGGLIVGMIIASILAYINEKKQIGER